MKEDISVTGLVAGKNVQQHHDLLLLPLLLIKPLLQLHDLYAHMSGADELKNGLENKTHELK